MDRHKEHIADLNRIYFACMNILINMLHSLIAGLD